MADVDACTAPCCNPPAATVLRWTCFEVARRRMLQAMGRAEKALTAALALAPGPERYVHAVRAAVYRDIGLRWVGIAEEAARNR